jgi:tRNA (cmo5U34)-methyltransferase
MKPNADNYLPEGKWAFNEDVAEVFAEMLENSIPSYQQMRLWTTRLAFNYLKPAASVVDLGASRGDAFAPLLAAEPSAKFLAIEASEPMREVLVRRFQNAPNVTVSRCDLRYDSAAALSAASADLVLSILTLMFVPVEYRQEVLSNVHQALKPGGALLLVEKVLGADACMDRILREEYYKFKADNGYTQEAIVRKKHSLEGVLVPVTAQWNIDLLKSVGFSHVDCFWRSLNFCGFLAVRS